MTSNSTMRKAAVAAWSLMAAAGAFAQAPAVPPHAPPRTDCRPEYPTAALRSGAQGVTGLAFHVDATGKVTAVDIVSSSGKTREHRLLDQEAARALSKCPIKVGTDANGQPIDSVVTVNYRWRLE